MILSIKTIFARARFVIWFLPKFLFEEKFQKMRALNIENPYSTLRYILLHKSSVSRFGDGEFALLSGNDTQFQRYNTSIANKLKAILQSNEKNHIVCLPFPWHCLFRLNYRAFEYWGGYLYKSLDSQILPFINPQKKYFDTNFTRFYLDWRKRRVALKIIPLIKQLWENKDVCIIEGEYTRMGVGNDLLACVRSIKRILCPPRNAYSVYDAIYDRACELPKTTLILISLGMTATCLAYDLAMAGYQAIDIGHVDIEYEWFCQNAKEKRPIEGKDVVEVNNLRPTGLLDENYLAQIICRISI